MHFIQHLSGTSAFSSCLGLICPNLKKIQFSCDNHCLAVLILVDFQSKFCIQNKDHFSNGKNQEFGTPTFAKKTLHETNPPKF